MTRQARSTEYSDTISRSVHIIVDDWSNELAVCRHSTGVMNGNGNGDLHEFPLKAPAVEIIDLQAESGEEMPYTDGCDAWKTEEESEEEDQDEDGLSIYEEALAAMDDEELADGGKSPLSFCYRGKSS